MKKKYYKYLLTLGHWCSDINQGALPSILPFLIAAYNLNYTTAAVLVFLSNALGSLLQPLIGDLADRKNIPWIMVLGIMLAAGGMSLTGFMTSFAGLGVCVTISGIGSALFHPQAARLVNKVAEKGKKGFAISIFSFGGNLGFITGPIVATAAITTLGLKGTGFLCIPALVCSGFLFVQSKNFSDEGLRNLEKSQAESAGEYKNPVKDRTDFAERLDINSKEKDQWKAFLLLIAFVIGRAIVLVAMDTFISLFFIYELGTTKVFGNAMYTFYNCITLMTTLYGGTVADRFGYVRVVRIAMLLLSAAAIMFSFSGSVPVSAIILIFLATGANLSYSPIVVLGQQYLPNHLGLASGLTLGLARSVGGLMSPVFGMVADAYGLRTVMFTLAIISLIPTVVGLFLPPPLKTGE